MSSEFRHICTFLAILGVLPKFGTAKARICYTAILICVDIVLFLFLLELIVHGCVQTRRPYFLVEECPAHIFFVLNWSLKYDKLKKLIDTLEHDFMLPNRKHFLVTFYVSNVAVWFSKIYEAFMITLKLRINYSLSIWLLFVIETYYMLAMNLACWLIYGILVCVCNKLGRLNRVLVDRPFVRAEELSKLYSDLCDLANDINEVFGSFLLYYFSVTFLIILCPIFIGSFYGSVTLKFSLIFGLTNIHISLFQIALAVKSEQVLGQSHRFRANSLRRSPVISAAGFLTYNKSMLFMLAHTAATYIIVALQFINNRNTNTILQLNQL